MKYIKVFAFLFCVCINITNAQNVQRWETWQSNLLISDGNAKSQANLRNWGLHLFDDAGFGMELHMRGI